MSAVREVVRLQQMQWANLLSGMEKDERRWHGERIM